MKRRQSKRAVSFWLALAGILLAGCKDRAEEEECGLMIAAAASLEQIMEQELLPLFRQQYPAVGEILASYDSSGRLMTQIEEGAEADVFFSASCRQMEELAEGGYVDPDSVERIVENEIVLIVPAGREEGFEEFSDILKAEHPAVGDPDSVPAGQYAREALKSLGLWEETASRASLASNVTQVLNWVAEGSAGAGIVYATDAAGRRDVTVVAAAPEGSAERVCYPAGIVNSGNNKDTAREFIRFLQSEQAREIFAKHGFQTG